MDEYGKVCQEVINAHPKIVDGVLVKDVVDYMIEENFETIDLRMFIRPECMKTQIAYLLSRGKVLPTSESL
jgi:hypothetical protein